MNLLATMMMLVSLCRKGFFFSYFITFDVCIRGSDMWDYVWKKLFADSVILADEFVDKEMICFPFIFLWELMMLCMRGNISVGSSQIIFFHQTRLFCVEFSVMGF